MGGVSTTTEEINKNGKNFQMKMIKSQGVLLDRLNHLEKKVKETFEALEGGEQDEEPEEQGEEEDYGEEYGEEEQQPKEPVREEKKKPIAPKKGKKLFKDEDDE